LPSESDPEVDLRSPAATGNRRFGRSDEPNQINNVWHFRESFVGYWTRCAPRHRRGRDRAGRAIAGMVKDTKTLSEYIVTTVFNANVVHHGGPPPLKGSSHSLEPPLLRHSRKFT